MFVLAFVAWCWSGLGQYASQLQFASSASVFHANHPVGMYNDGRPIESADIKQHPNFARESLEKACTDILIPVLTFKKQSALHGQSNASQITFVKDPSHLNFEFAHAAALCRLMLPP